MTKLSTDPYRGTRDFLPQEMAIRTKIFSTIFHTVELFGFRRYDGPILEPTAIYEAKSGEEIVGQQMYTLQDKGGRSLALRPEMTPTIARIVAGNQHSITFPSRWYSHGNFHRYERPQRGRVREHWQLNVDLFGSDDIGAEIEIFELIAAVMASLGADPSMYVIRVGDRLLLDAALRNYVGVPSEEVGAVGKIIDRWEKVDEGKRTQALADVGLDARHIERLEQLLSFDLEAFSDAAGSEVAAKSRIAQIDFESMEGVPARFDPLIVRGFDYYSSTVFEVFDTSPVNRRSLFGGGRYDNLAALFTDRRIPGIGFGMGDVTTWQFLENRGLLPEADLGPDVFVLVTKAAYAPASRRISKRLREAGVRTVTSLDEPSMKSGLKFANQLGARYTIIIGDQEFESESLMLKNMRTSEQQMITEVELMQRLERDEFGVQ
jgi:histidyl-tRNA synthetase